MSLLQGLLGFGVGAAGAFAEQKKADIGAQRQANLARLQAQYKGEAQIEQARKVAGFATSEDPEERAMASVLGYSPAQADDNRTALERNAQVAFPDNPDMQRQFIQQGGKMGGNTPTIEETFTQGGYEYAILDNRSVVRLDPNAPGGMLPVSGSTSTAPRDPSPTARETSPPPPSSIARIDSAPEADQGTEAQKPTKTTIDKLSDILGENVAAVPPQDIVSLGTGPIDTLKSIGLRLPIIGDLLGAAGDQAGPAQERARIATQFIENKAITTYKQNDGRTSNLEMGLNLKLTPKKGFLSTDDAYYNGLAEYRRNLFNDINYNINILEDAKSPIPTFSAENASVAREFLRDSFGLLQTIDGVITAYGFQNETIPVNGRRVRIRDLSQEDIMSLGPETQLTPQQYNLIDAWEEYNNWKQ